jgi:hypothetical protein
MSFRLVVGLLGGLSCLAMTSLSQAQCSMDTECKGDRVCEEGTCVAPHPTPATSTAPVATPAASAPAPVTSAPAEAAPPPRSTQVVDVRRKRHSTGMMAGGIVMVSFVPIALLAAWIADIQQNQCEIGYGLFASESTHGTNCDRYDPTIYGGLISAAVLLGAGVPMIIIGGKKEPAPTAKLAPWASPQAAGLSLRLDL